MLIIIPQQQDIPECVYLGNEQFSMYVHVCVWSVGVGNHEAACVVVAVSTWVSFQNSLTGISSASGISLTVIYFDRDRVMMTQP